MDEPTAWLKQAWSDRQAAELLISNDDQSGRCHAIAKFQQTVEKSVKALVFALHHAGVIQAGFRPRHEVAPYLAVLVRLPGSSVNRTIQQQLHGLLNQETRTGMRTLDGLTPGFPPRRNTEYPFRDGDEEWTYPAAEETFFEAEVQRFRDLAYRVLIGAERIVSAIRGQPN